MGSSTGEPSTKSIDASVGALVWVRRRNGSWWPGRIVGLDEVSEGCLVSPKSGTPVKLLGREDASIDWYNLEKSKRVKVFRCGEYDACIERVRAAAVGSNKKGIKYARREDAILHALEIESALLGKNDIFYSRLEDSDPKHDILVKESPTLDDASNGGSNLDVDLLSAPELSYSGTSFEESNHSVQVQTEQETSEKTPIDSEDDGMEGSKRMRGLHDLGMDFVSDRKAIEPIQQDNGHFIEANGGNYMVNEVSMNGGKGSSSFKRKRSQVAYLPEFLKKKNRRRQLRKVLESTAMVSVPVTCEEYASSCVFLANNSESMGLLYENGVAINDVHRPHDNGHVHGKMKKELSSLLDPPDNQLYDVPLTTENKSSAAFPSVYPNGSLTRNEGNILGRQQSSHSSQVEALQPEGINGYGFPDSSMEKSSSTSKWQSKGKRNSRHQNKKKRRVVHLQRAYQNGVDVDRPFNTKSLLETEDRANGIWDRTNHQQSHFTLHTSYPTHPAGSDGTFYDVELMVNAKSDRSPSDVPLVSLMSKMNRKAILGHPLAVEALADVLVICPEIGQPRSRCLPLKHVAKPKKNVLMSKKMRKLSSLTGGQRKGAGEGREKPFVEKLMSPVVSCIPLRLVFSRLNEAVNGSWRHRLLQSASIHT